MNHAKQLLSILIILTFALGGCLHDADDPISETKPEPLKHSNVVLKKPENCGEFKQYLTHSLIEQYLDYQGGRWGWCPNCRAFANGDIIEAQPATGTTAGSTDSSADSTTAGSAQGDASKSADPGSVTGTNNQEAGIDELDRLKTDSKGNMYLVQDNELIIIDAFPASDMTIASRLNLEINPAGLFIDEANQKAIIISQYWTHYYFSPETKLIASDELSSSYPTASPNSPEVIITIVDISDLANPELLDTLHVNGNFNSARMIDSRLHLIVNHFLYNIEESFLTNGFYKDLDRYWKAKELDFDSLNEDIAKLYSSLSKMIGDGIETLDINTIFPYYQINETEKTPLLSCTQVYHPDLSLKSSNLISVVSMDSDGSNLSTSATFSSGGIVYASAKSIYIAQPSGGWWWTDAEQQTAIHKFSLMDKTTEYIASGLVAGAPQKSFNFSEHNGNLRVATTEASWPDDARGRVTTNHLFILQDDEDGKLTTIGSVENFAKNESIMSARFLGDKGFVVTFQRIDPLFTFDLSNPTAPLLMGELEIPGFSTYMHPVGDNHLLTIGRAGTENGATQETQLQLFDISDMSNPVLIDAHIPQLLRDNKGYSYSLAEADHHAFTYSTENNILAIPLSYYNWQSSDSFAGIATFKIDLTDGISENGNVDHSSFINTNNCDEGQVNGGIVLDTNCINHYYQWRVQPNRSVITSDENGDFQLYSLSRLGIKANDLNNMETELGSLNW